MTLQPQTHTPQPKRELVPLGNNLIVSEIELKRETSSGLSLPDTTELETPSQGKVVSLSEEIVLDSVRIGSEIVYPKHAGMEIILDDTRYRILEKEDVLAVILES